MKCVDIVLARHHYRRAKQCLDAMRLLEGELETYGNGAAILAVHSVLSFADSVRAWYTGKRGKSQAHPDAVPELKRVCTEQKKDRGGCRCLSWLVNRKTDLEYGDRRLDLAKDIKQAVLMAKQFYVWQVEFFPNVVLELENSK
ncbi:MAG TPA: hypothetical protein VKX17_04905 [Planctomycetota bacterium]|nr:hypothetical protein [Planctomycetota bacterium]